MPESLKKGDRIVFEHLKNLDYNKGTVVESTLDGYLVEVDALKRWTANGLTTISPLIYSIRRI